MEKFNKTRLLLKSMNGHPVDEVEQEVVNKFVDRILELINYQPKR